MDSEVQAVRPQVNTTNIAIGMGDVSTKLRYRLEKKGWGAYASKHEILGILVEEMKELVEAIQNDSSEGLLETKEELLDVAVGALFGYICINSGYIK